MAIWPWVVGFKNFGQKLDDFPNLRKWFEETVGQRPAVGKGKAVGLELRPKPGIYTDEQRKILFGQTAAVVRLPSSRPEREARSGGTCSRRCVDKKGPSTTPPCGGFAWDDGKRLLTESDSRGVVPRPAKGDRHGHDSSTQHRL